MTSDIVKALEDLLQEPVHCTRCGYYGFFASLDPPRSPCKRCDELRATVERALQTLDAVPVLEWKDCENPEYSSIAQINSHFRAIACANGWWEIRASFVPESIAYSQASSKTVDGAKTEVAARLREMGVLFRTVKP